MNDEKLIECVRQHVVLYDVSDPKYMDTIIKNDVWVKIGVEMNVDGKACKNRWYNIRDTYRKALKRSASKSGKGAKNIKMYKYADQLGFLKRYLEERDTVSSFSSQEELQETVNEENSSPVQVSQSEETEDYVQELNVQCILQPPQTPLQPKRKFGYHKSLAAKKLQPVKERGSSELMDYLIGTKSNVPTIQQHPVDVFLNAMAPALKNLSPYDWHLAKSEIFNTVQKYELKGIMAQQNFVSKDNSVSPSNSGMAGNSSESFHRDRPSESESFGLRN